MYRKFIGSEICSRFARALSLTTDSMLQHNRGNLLNRIPPQELFQFNTRWNYSSVASPAPIVSNLQSSDDIENKISLNAIDKINEQVSKGEEGRLFAVVHICGKQFKITAEDIIIIEGYWAPHPSDQIVLEKVLLVGGIDFTLVGRPILPQGLVSVTATVIEKDLSHTKPLFYKRRRKQYMRLNFYRSQYTMLRINNISVVDKVNEYPDIQQYKRI